MKELLIRYWNDDEPFGNAFWVFVILGSIIYLLLAYLIINYVIPWPPNLVLTTQGPSYYLGNFTIFDAKSISLRYFIAGLLYLPYLFFALTCVLRMKTLPKHKIQQYFIKIFSVYIFLQSIFTTATLGSLYFGFTATNTFLQYILHDTYRNQTIFEPRSSSLPNALIIPANLIIKYTQHAIPVLYTYDYVNYYDVLGKQASPYFSKAGWERYKNYINKYDYDWNIGLIVDKKLGTAVTAMDTPKIVQEGDFMGKHYWVVFVHTIVTLYPTQKVLNPKAVSTDRHFYVLISQQYATNNLAIEGFIDE